MEIVPIFSALRRNPIGALLIVFQIAITLAIVCNSLVVLSEHARRMQQPTGLDETNVFTLTNAWAGRPTDLRTRIQSDLNALRSLPDVVDAVATNSFPLRGGGFGDGIAFKSGQKQPIAQSTIYMVDEHGLSAWGLRLIAGRWFNSDEIGQLEMGEKGTPPAIVVTHALAKALFPRGDALGKDVYLVNLTPQVSTRIVGIVERAQSPWAASSWTESSIENASFVPYIFVNSGLFYVVHAQRGQLKSAMWRAEKRLYEIDQTRQITLLQPYSATRSRAYRLERNVNVIVGTVCSLLLVVTAFGIVGLTTYWVAQRRRQIGVRRALGAQRVDILRYFHTENLLITVTGAVLGVVLGVGANLWLVTSLQLTRMSLLFILTSALIVLGLGQLAVMWPALRAASVPPAIAVRGV